MRRGVSFVLLIVPYLLCAQTGDRNTLARVPFVGCESDGQLGPTKAPTGESKEMSIPHAAAERLAYYQSQQGPGVLAPSGWHCFGTIGSDGAALYVSPKPIKLADLTSDKWKGFTGAAIQITLAEGGTSGRFEVARVIARVFPAHYAFVDSVIDEGIEPASMFPRGHYPHDQLIYRGDNVVEFTTPANRNGLGTMSRFRKNGSPIHGVAILLGDDPDLLQSLSAAGARGR